jgi:hypothetical protein
MKLIDPPTQKRLTQPQLSDLLITLSASSTVGNNVMANPFEQGFERPHDRPYEQMYNQGQDHGIRNLTPTSPNFPLNGSGSRMQPFQSAPRPPPAPPAPLADQKSEKQASITTSVQQVQPPAYFHSRRKAKGEIEKPWLKTKDRRRPWVSWIPCLGLLIGVALSGLLIYGGMRSTNMPEYCQILDEDFSRGLDTKIWTKEAEVGGYGNGQFEETTVTDENVFIRDGQLVIKPTLQDAKLIETNNIINLTKQGICTEATKLWSSCVTSTNTTNGTIIQPVKSGRISTKKGATIKYGKLPTGYSAGVPPN